MPLPKKKQFIQEVAEPSVKDTWKEKGYFTETKPMVQPVEEVPAEAVFLQEINEPTHEEDEDEESKTLLERIRQNIRFP